jgi:3-methyl-2-oxobutanoate hydroxymethyltransferase
MQSSSRQRLLVSDIRKKWESGERLAMITAYDHAFAGILDAAGVDLLLVGDSLASTIQGERTTLPVTLEQMIYHAQLVVRGSSRAFVVVDMPFLSYQTGVRDALFSAGRLMKETGVGGVKLEGGARVRRTVRMMTESGIPVMGHLGLLPQSYHTMGGYRVQGREAGQRQAILDDARYLEDAGAFSVVLEGVPENLAQEVSASLHIPTIGIGAGRHCGGQVLVLHDLLGLHAEEEHRDPRFVKRYAELTQVVRDAVRNYIADVRSGAFPEAQHVYEGQSPATTPKVADR